MNAAPVRQLSAIPDTTRPPIRWMRCYQSAGSRPLLLAATCNELFGWHPAPSAPQKKFCWKVSEIDPNFLQVADDWLVCLGKACLGDPFGPVRYVAHFCNLSTEERSDVPLQFLHPWHADSLQMRLTKKTSEHRALIFLSPSLGLVVLRLNARMKQMALQEIRIHECYIDFAVLPNQNVVRLLHAINRCGSFCYRLSLANSTTGKIEWDHTFETSFNPRYSILSMSSDGTRLFCTPLARDIQSVKYDTPPSDEQLPFQIQCHSTHDGSRSHTLSYTEHSTRSFDPRFIVMDAPSIGILSDDAFQTLYAISLDAPEHVVAQASFFPFRAFSRVFYGLQRNLLTAGPSGMVLGGDSLKGRVLGWSLQEHWLLDEERSVQAALEVVTEARQREEAAPEPNLLWLMLRHVVEHTLLLRRRFLGNLCSQWDLDPTESVS